MPPKRLRAPRRGTGCSAALVWWISTTPRCTIPVGRAVSSRLFLCRTAASGEERRCLLEIQPADVVISDLRMPGISGMDFRRSSRTLSASGFDGQTRRFAHWRARDGYLLKPFDADVVLGSLYAPQKKAAMKCRNTAPGRMVSTHAVPRTALQQTERSYEDNTPALQAPPRPGQPYRRTFAPRFYSMINDRRSGTETGDR